MLVFVATSNRSLRLLILAAKSLAIFPNIISNLTYNLNPKSPTPPPYPTSFHPKYRSRLLCPCYLTLPHFYPHSYPTFTPVLLERCILYAPHEKIEFPRGDRREGKWDDGTEMERG